MKEIGQVRSSGCNHSVCAILLSPTWAPFGSGLSVQLEPSGSPSGRMWLGVFRRPEIRAGLRRAEEVRPFHQLNAESRMTTCAVQRSFSVREWGRQTGLSLITFTLPRSEESTKELEGKEPGAGRTPHRVGCKALGLSSVPSECSLLTGRLSPPWPPPPACLCDRVSCRRWGWQCPSQKFQLL